MIKHIPNTLTLVNLICGVVAIVLASGGYLAIAAVWIGVAAFFDLMDGMLARLLKVQSEIGKQLDSLSDLVSFGVAPAMIMYYLIKQSNQLPSLEVRHIEVMPFIALIIPVCSAIRLAKFNLFDYNIKHFVGLPTPANAIFIASFPLIVWQLTIDNIAVQIILNFYFLLIITVLLSLLMVSKIKLFSLKFENYNFVSNKMRYFFIGTSILLFSIFNFLSIPMIVSLYILLSIINPVRT